MIATCELDSIQTNWKHLYLAAICETDKGAQAQRISEAEHAIFLREREIFYAPATLEEKEALEDALYALRALKAASEHCDRRMRPRLGP
jgi:hypothetical protein